MDISQAEGQESTETESLFSGESQEAAPEVKSQPDQDLSKRLEFLSRKERELMARERKYKEQMEMYKKYETDANEYGSLKQMASNDPLELLSRFGLDMDKLTNHVMQRNDGLSYQEKQSLLDRIEKQEKRFEELEARTQQEKLNETYNYYLEDLREVAAKDPDRWEMVNGENAFDLAFQAADAYYNQHHKMVDHEEVLDIVEQYLDQQHSKGLKYKKVQGRIGNKQDNESESSLFQQPSKQQSYAEPKTLTNSFASVSPSTSKFMTPQESKDRIAKMLGTSLWE